MLRLILAVLFGLPLAAGAAVQHTISSFPGTVQVTVDPWTTSAKVDLLFVIDDSGSMTAHQQNLARGADRLLGEIGKNGWNLHVGVVTTSGETQLGLMPRQWTSVDQSDFVEMTRANLQVGQSGSATEMPLAAMVAALGAQKDAGFNAGFRRPDARLMVVLVTDAEDQSPIPVSEAIAALKAQSTGESPRVIAAIVPSANTRPDCSRDDSSMPPVRLEEFLSGVGGETVGLCGDDMAARLTEATVRNLGRYVEPSSLRAIELPSAAAFETIRVSYGGDQLRAGDVNGGWIYLSSNKTVMIGDDFDYGSKPFGTKLVIDYTPLEWK